MTGEIKFPISKNK